MSIESNNVVHEHLRNCLPNNAVCNKYVTLETIDHLYRSCEFFDYQLCLSFFHHLPLRSKAAFDSYLVKLLSMAKTTFIELPNPKEGMTTKNSHMFPTWFDKPEEEVINSLSGFDIKTKVLGTTRQFGFDRKLIRVDIDNMVRHCKHHYNPPERLGNTYILKYNKPDVTLSSRRGKEVRYKTSGINVNTLLQLGLVDKQREELYKQFLSMPIYRDMALWNILFSAGKLVYIEDKKIYTHDDVVCKVNYEYARNEFLGKPNRMDELNCDEIIESTVEELVG